ncbi:hypothetical protein D3C77_497930 [compost metagenome]
MQVGQQTPAQILHIGGPLAQVGVVHQLEAIDVLGHHLAQRTLGPLPGLDHLHHFAAQGRVIEHHQVDVEQRALFRAQLGGKFGGEVAHVFAHPFQGIVEKLEFGVDVIDGLVGHHVEIGRRQHDNRLAHCRAGRTRHTDELGFLDTLALTTKATDRTRGLGMGNNTGELGAHGHQEGFFALVELATLLLLDNQYPHHTPVVDDRCT